MSIYEKKEKSQLQLMQEQLKRINKRLIALNKKLLKEQDMNLAVELVRLRSNLLYKQEALKNRLSGSTKGKDVMNYSITIVQ